MSRITAPVPRSTALEGLKDDEPYRAQIKGQPDGQPVGWGDFGYGNTMFIDWQLDNEPDITLRDFIGLALGSQRDGRPARLRQVLNALGQQPKDKPISWFDDETLEWSYDGDRPYAKLEVGLPLILRGESTVRTADDGTQTRRFVVTGYRPAGIAQHPADNPTANRRPAVVKDDEDDEIPF